MVKKAAIATPKQIELHRWCIEMAMRWPVIRIEPRYGNGLGQAGGYLPNTPGGEFDADVIGRAQKILNWITAAS